MKNVCIVGYGAIGPIHAKALEKVEKAKLFAVCDIDDARRAKCASQYSVAEYDDFDKMLQDEKIDSVHICTPHYLHFEMIKKALAAGKDVVVEKPVTMTKSEFEELKGLAGAERVCVVFSESTESLRNEIKKPHRRKNAGQYFGSKGAFDLVSLQRVL